MSTVHPFPCWGMRALVDHLLRSNLHEILSKSRLHCHARNVHSVMLLEAPQKTIRLFVAEPGNTLFKNAPDYFHRGMSVGFHAHHCDLTILSLRGSVLNWTVIPGDQFPISAFAYRSALRGQSPGFDHIGRVQLRTDERRYLLPGDSMFMAANQLHTVSTGADGWNAWLVFEGREDPNYSPVCYSTTDLEKEPFGDLYKPIDEERLHVLLREATLL